MKKSILIANKKRKKIRPPDVSAHAFMRYFERVLGFDLEAIKNDILSEGFMNIWGVCQPARARIPFCEEFRAVVQEGVIVTIVGKRDKKKGIKR